MRSSTSARRVFLAADDGTSGTQLWKLACTAARRARPSVITLPARAADVVRHAVPREGHVPGPRGRRAVLPDERRRKALLLGVSSGHRHRAVDERRHRGRHQAGADIEPGPGSSNPYEFTDVGGVAYFVALHDGAWHRALAERRHGGRHAHRPRPPVDHGTRRIPSGSRRSLASSSSRPGRQLRALQDRRYGSRTELVASAAPSDGHAWATSLYFISWRSAGADVGLPDGLALGRHGSKARTPLDKRFFLPTGNPRLQSLVSAGPTSTSARRGPALADRRHGAGTISLTPRDVFPRGARRRWATSSTSPALVRYGRELWRSDGTPEGTYMVADLNPPQGREACPGGSRT